MFSSNIGRSFQFVGKQIPFLFAKEQIINLSSKRKVFERKDQYWNFLSVEALRHRFRKTTILNTLLKHKKYIFIENFSSN